MLTDDEADDLIKSRQSAVESFLSAANLYPLEYDEETDEYEEADNTQVTEWVLVCRHQDFDAGRDFYSVMKNTGQAPHSTTGLLHLALEMFA